MKYWFVMVFFMGVSLFFGCATSASLQDRKMTAEELDKMEIIGSVQRDFVVAGRGFGRFASPPPDDELKQQAFSELLEEARKNHSGNIDIRNITISQKEKKQITGWGGGIEGYEFHYTASGNVVLTLASSRVADRLGGITNQIVNTFRGSNSVTIALFDFVNVNGKNSVLGRYLVEQISNYFFQNSNFRIVERTQIDRVMREQNFGMSGFVDDESAARIGHLLGANAVTIGTLTRVGNRISVNIKIVDSESGSILSSGSTEIDGSEYIEMYNDLLN